MEHAQALETSVVRVRGGVATPAHDRVAIERPLQIRVRIGDDERALSTTMRTPGDDVALAVGFLHAEGVLADGPDLRGAEAIDDDTVRVELGPTAAAALAARRAHGGDDRNACATAGSTSTAAPRASRA
jgi:FdhD protein